MVIQNPNSLTMKSIEQIRIIMSKTIFNLDFKIAPSPVGSQLKNIRKFKS